jgi:type II secretory pathway predicted ATPase ExeA
MFEDFYGFKFNPFDKSLKTKDFYLSKDYQQMFSRLKHMCTARGLGIFTAEPGMGKSSVLRCFASNLDSNIHSVFYICLTTLSMNEFYRQLCLCLQVEDSSRKSVMYHNIQARLYSMFKDQRKPAFIIIDEADELKSEILKELKMIMNFKYDSENCFSLALAGEPHLNNLLQKPIMEALRQRISVHYNFTGLSDIEAREYVMHKFRISGAAVSILEEGAISALISLGQGCPRMIDKYMVEALTIGAQNRMSTIEGEVIMAAVNNMALI